MFDVALRSAGAQVVLATSSDDKFPPENIIDGNQETFWTSTGIFPQEFIISFTSSVNIAHIQLACYNVKNIRFERCTDSEPLKFEPVTERELTATDGQLQHESIQVNSNSAQAQHLRVVIDSGYDHFVCVNSLNVEGNAVHG